MLYSACGGLLLGAGVLYYYFHSKSSSTKAHFSRDQILSVLKKFNRNFYPIFEDFLSVSEKIHKNYGKEYGHVLKAIKKSLTAALIENNPKFHKLLAEIEDQIYKEFKISDRKAFEKAADELAKVDIEIKLIMQEIQENIFNACNGVEMPMTIPLADHVTAETTLNVHKSIVYSILMELNHFLEEYVKEHKIINILEYYYNEKLQSILKSEKAKKEFLKLYQFDYSDIYHEYYVYASAIKQFSKKDDKYAKAINKIAILKKKIVRLHLIPGHNLGRLGKLREKIEEIMEIEIELTQPIIEVAPNAQAILDPKAKENQETAKVTGKNDEVQVEDHKKETQENKKPKESLTSEKPVPETSDVPETKENTEESVSETTEESVPETTPVPEEDVLQTTTGTQNKINETN